MRDEDARELEYLQQYVSGRQRRIRVPKRIDNLLSQLMARRGYAQSRAADDLQAAWKDAAGETLAGQSRCGLLRRGVLHIVVAHSAVVQEIEFQKRYLIRQLNKSVGRSKIQDLRCRIGAVE